MQTGALRALEFDRIVEAVRSFALTPMGRERLDRLAPSGDLQKVTQLLAATSETVRYLTLNPTFGLVSAETLPQILTTLAVEGRALDGAQLLVLAAFLDAVDEARAAIRRAPGPFHHLEVVTETARSFKTEASSVRTRIDPSGGVVDDASSELKLVRDRLRKQRSRLRGTLESYLRGKETAKYLQEQIVTERNGRYVLVIRAEHRAAIPGIVHGASTSGASLFLEPLSTVEINNDIVALEEQEAEEVRRILLALSNLFRHRAADVARTVDAATELDVLQAKARFSERIDAVEPILSADPTLDLRAARHPLLLPEVTALVSGRSDTPGRPTGNGRPPVPVTITIVPPATCLLVTGPNTGGKTVALKTAGLLALMAQAGMRIPAADGSRLPVFRSIFADIGDEQSIEASLSTFSAHVTNIAAMDRHLQIPALVLLDEIGSGTDPVEGGALGVAIVDHFRRRGAVVMATSHYDALKTYASTTDGVVCAAFGFDPETFAPTYELQYGSPGRSLALEVGARLGLSETIVAAARQNLGAREAQRAEQLSRLDRDLRALDHEHRLAARERETLEAAEARIREREETLRQREDDARRRVNEETEARIRQARREIDEVVRQLKARTDAMPKRTLGTGEAGVARQEARAALEAVASRFVGQEANGHRASEPPAGAKAPEVGDRVVVGALGLEATVTAIHDDTADLDVRGKRLRAAVRDLRVIGDAGPRRATVHVHVELQPRETEVSDLNVIGCTVDEALTRAERFLDESLLTDRRTIRLIHGYGTGQLKRALAGFLQQHPLVARFEAAPPDEGGGGVTVVELKD
jgi:DNA mismatch repair protein MutS2